VREPSNLQEAMGSFAELVREDPNTALLTLIEELVDLACSAGMPIRDNLHDYKKFKFYKKVVARLLLRKRSLTT
jgi:hypothetical protein